MEIPAYISQILKENKITDFLSDRGIASSKSYADKILYCCPLHEGDNDPSFFVYINKEHQSYYCFGCNSGYNVLNLLSEIDNISIRQAIRILGKGISVKEDLLERDLKRMESKKQNEDIEDAVLKINRNCHAHLKEVNWDKEQFVFFEKIFEKIDRSIHRNDLKVIQNIYSFLAEKGIPNKEEEYLEKQKKTINIRSKG